MSDETEDFRRARMHELNSEAALRQELEQRHGQVWSTDEMRGQFEVLGFAAPLILVRDRKTGQNGSLEFQHMPRMYFNWIAD